MGEIIGRKRLYFKKDLLTESTNFLGGILKRSWHTLCWWPLSAMISRWQAVHSTTKSSRQDHLLHIKLTLQIKPKPIRKLWVQNSWRLGDDFATGTLENSTWWLGVQGMRCTPRAHLVTRLELFMILCCNDSESIFYWWKNQRLSHTDLHGIVLVGRPTSRQRFVTVDKTNMVQNTCVLPKGHGNWVSC